VLPDDWLAQLRETYPQRDGGQGWGAVPRLVDAAISNGASWDRILLGAKNYAKHCRRRGEEGTSFVLQCRTFVGRDRHFEEWADKDMRTAAQVAEDRAKQALLHRAEAVGFRQPIPGEPPFRYEEALKEAERALQPRGDPKLWAVK
jgi:hypothetical protein